MKKRVVDHTLLDKAKVNKKDEFYTQLIDIEKEMIHYTKHFKNKTVYCNCDNPEMSNFWKYFHDHFVELKLKSRLNSFIKFGTWMSVYIVLTEDSSRNNEKFQKVVKYLSEGLKAELINKYNELFPSNKLTDNEI